MTRDYNWQQTDHDRAMSKKYQEFIRSEGQFVVPAFEHPRSRPLSPQELVKIRRRAMLSLRLDPLPPGNNDGLVYFAGSERIAFDSNGHEAFAEFISNAQSDVTDVVADLLDAREVLQQIADGLHLTDCLKVLTPELACQCHAYMAWGALNPEQAEDPTHS